jgi:circadian clock protein KaiC
LTRLTKRKHLASLCQALTGIDGLDEVTGGGLPKGRTTLAGTAGCGKSTRLELR